MVVFLRGFGIRNITERSSFNFFIGGGDSAGYVVVGVLCFMLGVCLTMLLYKLRDKDKNGGDK